MEIQGYENYLIYEDGRVFSKKRLGTNGGFLEACPNRDGYYGVNIFKDRKKRYFSIHRLIALHYIPNPNNYECVDHKDRNRQNNSIDNLRWVTKQMNNQNAGVRKDNKLRIQNICPTKSGYRFQKIVDGKSHRKRFKTLEEAIKYKEEYLRASQ